MAAILDAAIGLLERRPDASIADVANAAGVTRQTVYAHYGSREKLLNAVLDRAFAESVAAMDAARLDEGTATAALERLLEAAWETVGRLAGILDTLHVELSSDELDERHRPIRERVLRLVRRGQRSGEFDKTVSAKWVVATTIAVIHSAARQVAAGEITRERAGDYVRHTILRVVAAH